MLDHTIRQYADGVLVIEPTQATTTLLISKLRRVKLLKTGHREIDLKPKQLRLNENLTSRRGIRWTEVIKTYTEAPF